RGATVIVGPNGSGKSNISDAMRWVLGELSSRNLRGSKMEDVIFGGTDDRRPMGFAEVSVTFDNSDPNNRLDSEFDEVTVTRRYFRTGESEYLINRQPKRLRDIYELFMNTGVGREGYSIIGQGKVAEIVSKKSDDRRNIFEEAAGISKYRHRKEESERKLKSTQENLDRVKDILSELENRVGPLEKEAEKARKGLAIYEEKKRADVSLWLFDTKKIRSDIEEAEKNWMLAKHELEIVEQLIQDLEAQNDNLYNKTQSNKLLSEQLLEKIRTTTEKLHQLDNALRVAESEFAHSAELILQNKTRIDEIERSYAALEASKNEYAEKKKLQNIEIDKLSSVRDGYIEEQRKLLAELNTLKRALEESLDELTVEQNSANDLKVRIDFLKTSKISDGTKSQDLELEIKKYETDGIALKEEADRCEQNASGFKKQIADKDAIITEGNEKIDSLGEEKNEINESLNSLKLEHDTLSQRADVLQRMNEHFEGYAESVKFVMKEYNSGRIKGAGVIHGPLSSLIHVEKKYITAIETALGSSLQNVVVENEETAKAAINALKLANAGRATFYPISAIKSAFETEEIKEAKKLTGFVGRADTLVSSNDEYRQIIEWLLLRTVVFDNIDSASNAAKKLRYKVKIVTLDGQVINAGGAFTGGSAKRDSGILSRLTEITNLKERAKALDKKISETEKALSEIDDDIKQAQSAVKEAEQQKEILLTLSRSQFAALDNANAKYEANNNILEKLRFDFNNLITSQSKADEELKNISSAYSANLERIEALKNYRAEKSAYMGVLDEKSDEMAQKANDTFIKITEARKDAENTEQLIASIDDRLAELTAEKQSHEDRISAIEERRNNMDSRKAQNLGEYGELEKELESLNAERREVEKGSDEFEQELA
ncbi:MAG: chromosome segregation protein SMC, partial [Clostridia bacterium]|nr:chromosome segregation protein SMC [Clostridia bacterium]